MKDEEEDIRDDLRAVLVDAPADTFRLTCPNDDEHPHETNDDHETPEWVVDALFETPLGGETGETVQNILEDTDVCILEPCAGTGNIVRALNNRGYHRVRAVEIQAERFKRLKRMSDCEAHHADILSLDPADWQGVDAAILNPPWSCGQKFWRWLSQVDPWFCAMHVQWQAPCLDRFNGEFKKWPLTHAIPIQGRPSYDGSGETAKSEVGWFLRIKGFPPLWVAARKRELV